MDVFTAYLLTLNGSGDTEMQEDKIIFVLTKVEDLVTSKCHPEEPFLQDIPTKQTSEANLELYFNLRMCLFFLRACQAVFL